MTTKKLITSKQVDKVADLGEEAIKTALAKIKPESTNVQIGIITKGGVFKSRIEDAARVIILDMISPNEYKDEVVPSNHRYPKEFGIRHIDHQIKVISEVFNLDPSEALLYAKKLPPLPGGAEGWFAIPKVSVVAKMYNPDNIDYSGAVNFAIDIIAGRCGLTSESEVEFDKSNIRQHPETLNCMNIIEQKQKGDILIIPAQYGKLHLGESVRRARETYLSNEFGLGLFSLLCMAITHPNRYSDHLEINTDCPGDEVEPDNDETFHGIPFLTKDGSALELNSSSTFGPHKAYGSVTGFMV